MRSATPTLHCDVCESWSVDYYEATASTVNGVKITAERRAPGWTVTVDGRDICPECLPHLADVLHPQDGAQR